jgi:hypothetical protein
MMATESGLTIGSSVRSPNMSREVRMSDRPSGARRMDVGRVMWRVFAFGTAATFILFGVVDQSWWILGAGGCYPILCLWIVLTGRE